MTHDDKEIKLLRDIARLMFEYNKDKMRSYRLSAMKLAKEWHDNYQRGVSKETNPK